MNAHTPIQADAREGAVANFFRCSQTLRRLAHDAKRQALEWERRGHHRFYAECRDEANRLWRDAKRYLAHAKMNRRTP